jgi:hypothetical protein
MSNNGQNSSNQNPNNPQQGFRIDTTENGRYLINPVGLQAINNENREMVLNIYRQPPCSCIPPAICNCPRVLKTKNMNN